MNIEIVEIQDLRRKRRWYEKFRRGYKGACRPYSEDFLVKDARFFAAMVGSQEIGFIRINEKTSYFKGVVDYPVWSISEALIEKTYRSRGILRKLIKHVVNHCDVRMLHIEWSRYFENMSYYEELGFGGYVNSEQHGIGWVFLKAFDLDRHSHLRRSENDNEPDGDHAVA